MSYECKVCEFFTKQKTNYAKHCESNKHKKNVINAAKCECKYCNKEFACKKYLDAHVKLCSLKTNISIYKEQYVDEKIREINLLKSQLEKCEIEKKEIINKYEKINIDNINKYENEKKEIINKYENERNKIINKYENDKTKYIEQYENDKIKYISQHEKHIDIFTLELNNLHNIIKQSGTIIKSSMSGFKYAIKQFDKAPPLQNFTAFDLLKINKESVVQTALNKFEKNIIHEYIGDIIIKAYKKTNNQEQSMWNTDCARLSYIIKNIMENDPTKSEWKIDKNATLIKELIINPIFTYLKNALKEDYKKQNSKYDDKNNKIDNDSDSDSDSGSDSDYNLEAYMTDIVTYSRMSTLLIRELEISTNISQNIIKYITPHFYMNTKNQESIEK